MSGLIYMLTKGVMLSKVVSAGDQAERGLSQAPPDALISLYAIEYKIW